MDANTFDDLIKRLTTTPQTRTSVLRGLVASAALAAMTLVPESGTAKKNHENERKVCVCGADGTVGSCHTKKVKADKIKKLLRRNPCAFKGKCTGVNPCSTVPSDGGGTGGGTGGGIGGGASGGGCDPRTCPRDQSTNSTGLGFCCEGGFCSCGGICCSSVDCWIFTQSSSDGELVQQVVQEFCAPPTGCIPCPNSGATCCTSCFNGNCVSSGPIRGGTIRRR